MDGNQLTPQELMDLPYYGQAEKHLRKSGRWVLTKAEELEKIIFDMVRELNNAAEAITCVDNMLEELEDTLYRKDHQ